MRLNNYFKRNLKVKIGAWSIIVCSHWPQILEFGIYSLSFFFFYTCSSVHRIKLNTLVESMWLFFAVSCPELLYWFCIPGGDRHRRCSLWNWWKKPNIVTTGCCNSLIEDLCQRYYGVRLPSNAYVVHGCTCRGDGLTLVECTIPRVLWFNWSVCQLWTIDANVSSAPISQPAWAWAA